MTSIANAQTFQDALAAFKAGLTEGAPAEDFMGQLQSLISQFPTEFKATTEKTDAPKKRAKKVRDPNLPKRPKNAFMLFTDSVREEVKAGLIEASPDGKIRVSDVSKECGARWKALPDDEKQPFLDANAAAKTEYEKAMEDYYAENPDKKPVEKVKKEKNGKEPRRRRDFRQTLMLKLHSSLNFQRDGKRVLLDISVVLSRAKMANHSSSRLSPRQSLLLTSSTVVVSLAPRCHTHFARVQQ